MLHNLIDKMHEKKFREWKFEYFLVFVVINVMAWGECIATIATLALFFAQKCTFEYVVYAVGSAVLGISAFAYVVTAKDEW